MQLIKFHSYTPISKPFFNKGLEDSTLFFNNVFNFNDPFEGIFRFKIYSDYKDYEKWYMDNNIADPHKIDYYFNNKTELETLLNRTFKHRYDNNAVTCFSHEDNMTNILMWSHYGDNHKGLCLVFDGDNLKFNSIYDPTTPGIITTDPNGPHEINYSDDFLNQDPVIGRALNAKSFLTTKHSGWSYEREYRFIAPKMGSYFYDRSNLKRIIFGLRMKDDNKQEIKDIISSNGFDVLYNKVELVDNRFELQIHDD